MVWWEVEIKLGVSNCAQPESESIRFWGAAPAAPPAATLAADGSRTRPGRHLPGQLSPLETAKTFIVSSLKLLPCQASSPEVEERCQVGFSRLQAPHCAAGAGGLQAHVPREIQHQGLGGERGFCTGRSHDQPQAGHWGNVTALLEPER